MCGIGTLVFLIVQPIDVNNMFSFLLKSTIAPWLVFMEYPIHLGAIHLFCKTNGTLHVNSSTKRTFSLARHADWYIKMIKLCMHSLKTKREPV